MPLNCQQPSYLLDSLISYQSVRTLRSSSSNLFVVPNRVETVTASRAFRAAPTIWNNLPDSVKVADLFNVFKRRLKCHLFNKAFKTTANFQPASLSRSLTSGELRRLKSIKLYFICICITIVL